MGEEVVVPEHAEPPQVGDLMEALRRSVEATTEGRGGGAAAAKAGGSQDDLAALHRGG